jgi:phage anti-repressor protein
MICAYRVAPDSYRLPLALSSQLVLSPWLAALLLWAQLYTQGEIVNQLIPFEKRIVGTETIETVDGRDLHVGLEIGKDYTSWIKAQIKRAQLDKDLDYITFTQLGETATGGYKTTEYFLTFDASKHVAMMSGSKKGKEVREYFIACEKELRDRPALKGDMLVQMAEAYRKLEAQQERDRLALVENQQKTIEALEKAVESLSTAQRAETKADMVTDELRRFTLEEYVHSNGLLRQFPAKYFSRYSAWLKSFCLQYGLRIDKAPVVGKQWEEELAYPIQALAAWLRYEQTKPRQINLESHKLEDTDTQQD